MKVVIIGCGWLGVQIGQRLVKSGNSVFGSFRSEEKKEHLNSVGVRGFQIDLNDKSQISNDIIELTDILIISLPPQKKEKPTYYAAVLQNIVQQFPKETKVIFTSSTGVYPKQKGIYKEEATFGQQDKLTPLFLAERGLISLLNDRLTILRLGGLIGPNRHPVLSLQGRAIPNDGSCPINMIDSRDVVKAVELIIKDGHFGKIFNLVHPNHPTKKRYYSMMAKKYGFDLPIFNDNASVYRRVDGVNFNGIRDSLMNMMPKNLMKN